MTRVFGLIGKSLTHSFSKNYFTNKFRNEGITDCIYELFEIPSVDELPRLLEQPSLSGLNVTIPYKTEVLPLLDELDVSAQKVGAVNVIKREGNKLTGFNSDYYGFRQSLEDWLPSTGSPEKALVLGTGGAHQAVKVALLDMGIDVVVVSRTPGTGIITYEDLDEETIAERRLIVNTTPLGMFPEVNAKPDLSYDQLTDGHFLYDLVYNPEETSFMKAGAKVDAGVKNGLEMLHLQAEKSWRSGTVRPGLQYMK